jgi:hypothetical protein
MPNGFGGGRGFGRGFGGGMGFGRGFGGGMGFGFRGTSPPWPYVGRGRGGLPRCGYFLSGAGAPAAWPYPQAHFYGAPLAYEYGPPAGSMTREGELSYLRDQAEAIRGQLEEIEARISRLSTEK